MIRYYSTDEIKTRLDQGERLRLIDVREPDEYQIARIDGTELLPMSQIQTWWSSLPRDAELIFFCHHGVRSQQVALALAQQAGFQNVGSMNGGIEEWSLRIDPQVPRY